MNSAEHALELIFVTSNGAETDALVNQIQTLSDSVAALRLAELVVEDALGAVTNEKIITAVLTFSLNVAAGVLGNVVYNLLQDHTDVQCVAGEHPITPEDFNDLPTLEAKLLKASKPSELATGSQAVLDTAKASDEGA